MKSSQTSVTKKSNNIEDIYPLSPMQEGLLFHTIYAPASGVYLTQLSWLLHGELDVAALERTWQQVIERHTVLRTAFVWEGRDKPVQVVRRRVNMPMRIEDWRGAGDEEQKARLGLLLKEDREQGFQLTKAPLMRLTLIRLAENAHQFVWSHHHLLLDGWSVPLVLNEVFAIYQAESSGGEVKLHLPRPYRDYIVWLQQQDVSKAESFWRQNLKGITRPATVGKQDDHLKKGARIGKHLQQHVTFSETITAELQSLARSQKLTLNTVLQGLWALILSHYSGQSDVVFGAVVSGRPATLRGVESIVGVFINTVPVRATVTGEDEVLSWLKSLQASQAQAREYEHTPLLHIHAWSEVPRDTSLFEAILVFDNYPAEVALQNQPGDKKNNEVCDVRCISLNHYPLTITLIPGRNLFLEIDYDCDRFEAQTIKQILDFFRNLLESVVANPHKAVKGLQDTLKKIEAGRKTMERVKRDETIFNRFKNVSPKAVKLSPEKLVKADYARPGCVTPLILQPAVEAVDLPDWGKNNTRLIDAQLIKHGAILFRNFRMDSVPRFEQFAQSVCHGLFNENGEHPRKSVSGNVYTPVFYPPDKQLLWHNENSFNHQWPAKILFCCVKPAEQGGETPLVDSRKVFDLIAPRIKEEFINKGVMYVRNYGYGLGLDWQAVFHTSDREKIEEHCNRAGMSFEWKSGDRLRTRAVRPAVIKHPVSGEMSWFNQAQHWHISCLDTEVRETFLESFAEEDLPRHCYYGDGSKIPDSVMEEICEVYRKLEVSLPWQRGDLLMVENLLTAHARNPFVGERQLLVAMGQMMSYDEI